MENEIGYNSDFLAKRWVGYFDLLGIKRLHQTKNHLSIFFAYSKAIEKVKETNWSDTGGYAWFSDTFIVYTKDDSIKSFDAIESFARWFLYFLITANIPVKGAISCGDLYVDSENTLFLGEALIEAYEWGENQDWIGLLLCPSMEERFKGQKMPAGVRLNYASTYISFREHPKEQPGNLKNNLQACILGKWIFVNNQNPIIKKGSSPN
jgi:hypothetical protein